MFCFKKIINGLGNIKGKTRFNDGHLGIWRPFWFFSWFTIFFKIVCYRRTIYANFDTCITRAASRQKIKRLLDGGGANSRGGEAPEENFFPTYYTNSSVLRYFQGSKQNIRFFSRLFFFKNHNCMLTHNSHPPPQHLSSNCQ